MTIVNCVAVYNMNADIKPNQVRLGEHTDYGSVTLVFQGNVGGLQVGRIGYLQRYLAR